MKKTFLLLLLGLNFSLNLFAQQAFEVMTKNPTPGSVIGIEYVPRSTVLQGVKDFEATAYLLEGKLPRAVAVPLKQDGGIFRGSVKTADSTKAVFFSFAKDETQDNNNDEGYYTLLYDKAGKPVTGARWAAAAGFNMYGGIWSLKRNAQKASELNKAEFAEAGAKEKLAAEYLTMLSQSRDSNDKAELKALLAERLAKSDVSEADLIRYKGFYEGALRDKDAAIAIKQRMQTAYPSGRWRFTDANNRFFALKTVTEKEKLYTEEIAPMAPFSKEEEGQVNNEVWQIANMYTRDSNYAAAKKYAAMIPSPTQRASALNAMAWKLSGQGFDKKPVDVAMGLDLSKQSLDLIEAEKKSMKAKPAYLTDKQYVKSLESSYHMYGDTYATLLYHKGDLASAYAYEKAAVDFYKGKVPERNEALALLTEKLKGPKETQALLEKSLEDGKYTPPMKEQLKRLYTASGKNEAEWNAYVSNLEEAAYNKLKAELAKKMINVPAPMFALKDMSGKEVALSTLKGKIVVVDFWATWCGPCIASFPGMQMAVNKYKNNPDVVFLFVDTWENDSNRVQKVTDFIAKNKYSFHVLYDDPKAKEGNAFVVVDDFKVEGIPTKFVIDRANNIRFKTIGFNGSADGIVSELTAMIDMAASESGAPLKKGF